MITSLAYSVNTTHRFDMPSSFRVSTKCTLPTSRPRVSDSQARQDSEETWRPESVSSRDRNRNEFPSVPLDYCQTQCGVRCRKYGPAPRLPGRLDQYCKLQKAATAPGLASAPGSRGATLAQPSQPRSHSGCAAVWLSAIALSERFCHTRDRHGGACDTTPQVELWQGMPDKQHPTACG